jgi:hypothetical protein
MQGRNRPSLFVFLRVFRRSPQSGYADGHALAQTPPLVFAVAANGITVISVGFRWFLLYRREKIAEKERAVPAKVLIAWFVHQSIHHSTTRNGFHRISA